jgi:hypothetical protein
LFFFFFFSFDSTRGSRTGNFHPPRKEKWILFSFSFIS